MRFDIKQIEHLAKLARLNLTNTEKKKFGEEISSILKYVEQLAEVKEAGGAKVQPPAKNNWRPDQVENCLPEIVKQILTNAPEKEGNLFKVKAVFE